MTGFCIVAFSSVFGFASILPPIFLVAALTGASFGLVVVGALNIITLLIDSDPETSALYFFVTAGFIVLCALIFILVSFQTPSMQYYIQTLRSQQRPDLAESPGTDECTEEENKQPFEDNIEDELIHRQAYRASRNSIKNVISNKEIISYVMRKTWLLQLDGFLLHLGLGSLFPSIASAVHPQHYIKGDLWSSVLFVPTLCFMVGYIGQFTGRFLPRLFLIVSFSYKISLIKKKNSSFHF